MSLHDDAMLTLSVWFLLPIHAGDAHSTTPKGDFERVSAHVTVQDYHQKIPLFCVYYSVVQLTCCTHITGTYNVSLQTLHCMFTQTCVFGSPL